MLKGEVKNESFVIHADFLQTLPEALTSEWAMHIVNYGFCGIEPDFSDWAQKELWQKLKSRIDTDHQNYEERKEKNRKKVEEWRARNNVTVTSGYNGLQKVTEGYNGLQKVTPYTNTQCVSEFDSDSVSVSEFESVSVSEFDDEYVSVSDSVSDAAPSTTTTAQDSLFKAIFEKWNNTGLPCCKGNYISWLQKDCKNGMAEVRKLKVHSDDLLKACDNYIKELNDSSSYITQKMNFERFAASQTFKNCLPENYIHSNFVKFGEEPKPEYKGRLL